MDTYSNFKGLAQANGTAVYESNIGLNATFNTLYEANSETANTVDTTNIAKLNTIEDDISEGLVLWNMALLDSLQGIRGCRNGLGIYMFSEDHGNAHVEIKSGSYKLAKIFIYPKTMPDRSQPYSLEKAEQDAVMQKIKTNIVKYWEKWNDMHKNDPAAQQVPIEVIQAAKQGR